MEETIDYCTGWFEGIGTAVWSQCCAQHDIAYAEGGNLIDKIAADQALGDCVSAIGGTGMGVLMFVGVSAFGALFWNWKRKKVTSGSNTENPTRNPTMSNAGIASFKEKAPWVMATLMADFGIGVLDAAAIVGNGGYESDGLRPINEAKPTVPGSRGGYSWFQWTGSRRVAFEAYCARNGLDKSSDVAAYKWLFVELKGDERRAIPAIQRKNTLIEKVEAFEVTYERAGIKNYPARIEWAQRALDFYNSSSAKDRLPPWTEEVTLPSVVTPAPAPAPMPTPTWTPLPDVVVPPSPDEVGGPIEKAKGAAKGAAYGSLGVGVPAGALLFIMDIYGLIPADVDSVTLGFAFSTLLGAASSVIMSFKGAYDAKKNSV